MTACQTTSSYVKNVVQRRERCAQLQMIMPRIDSPRVWRPMCTISENPQWTTWKFSPYLALNNGSSTADSEVGIVLLHKKKNVQRKVVLERNKNSTRKFWWRFDRQHEKKLKQLNSRKLLVGVPLSRRGSEWRKKTNFVIAFSFRLRKTSPIIPSSLQFISKLMPINGTNPWRDYHDVKFVKSAQQGATKLC